MISFDSTNLIVNKYDSSKLNIIENLSNSELDYIFKNYLFLSNTENISKSFIKCTYHLTQFKITTLLNDTNLSNLAKLLISYYFIAFKLLSANIYVYYNIQHPEVVSVIFTNYIQGGSISSISNTIRGTSAFNDELYYIHSSYMDTYEVEIVDNIFNSVNKKTHFSDYQEQFYATNIKQRETLALYKSDLITDEKFEEITNDSNFKALFFVDQSCTEDEHKYVKADGLVFELTINNIKYNIQLNNTIENYILKTELKTIFDEIKLQLPSQLFDFKQYSYIVPHSNVIKYRRYLYGGNVVETYNHPLYRQNDKFSLRYITDVPPQFDVPPDSDGSYSINIFRNIIQYNFQLYNSYLYNYMTTNYNYNSNIITNENDQLTFKSIYFNNIKSIQNDYYAQFEYQDLHGSKFNENIGTVSNSEFIDIQGIDSTKGEPIILYVSKIYETNGFNLRNYKLTQGGIEPINNAELNYKYDDSTVNYIEQLTVIDYTGEQFEYDTLSSYIHNITQSFNTNYSFNNVLLDNKITKYYDFQKTEIQFAINYLYVYKNNNQPILILNDNINEHPEVLNNILPYEVLLIVMRNDNLSDILTKLNEIFYDNINYSLSSDINIKYNSLYFNYINIISYNSYYLLNKDKQTVYSTCNKTIIDSFKIFTKFNQFEKLINIKPIIKYKFDNLQNNYFVDATNDTINFADFKNNILNLITYDTYNINDPIYFTENEIISLLLNKTVYDFNIQNYTNKYLMLFYKYKTLLDTDDKFFIFNKVIGVDQLLYYSLQSDENDNSFTDYLFNIYSNQTDFIIIVDLENNELFNLSYNNHKIKISDKNPPIINIDILEDPLIYSFDKSQLNLITDEYKKTLGFKSYTNSNIVYSTSTSTNNLLFKPYATDRIILG